MEDSMGILLAVLVFAALTVGFVSLMVLPLFFIWLAVAVFREPWKEEAPDIIKPQPKPVPEPEQPTEVDRPRVMVAGRRRPL
jgi:hypothetical protein